MYGHVDLEKGCQMGFFLQGFALRFLDAKNKKAPNRAIFYELCE